MHLFYHIKSIVSVCKYVKLIIELTDAETKESRFPDLEVKENRMKLL